MHITGWTLHTPREPMRLDGRQATWGPGEVVVEVAGCGVCHTDLGFFSGAVPTRHPLPLVLGHEVAGRVVAAGDDAGGWLGRTVVVPAVMPCGRCAACRADQGAACRDQIFPGNDVHGGFASHLVVPSEGLCPVPDLADVEANPKGLELATLSVIADAVTTPYRALTLANTGPGDLAVFVGAGGVGGFGVQVAAALGARVVAIDIDRARLERLAPYGADLLLDASELGFRDLKRAVRTLAAEHEVPSWKTKIFECSGTPSGQETAFGLLGHGGHLGVVGYTHHKVDVRLSNLMALDATARGNWGCPPAAYPAVLDLVLAGRVDLPPFVEYRPLSLINDTFRELEAGHAERRFILVPEV